MTAALLPLRPGNEGSVVFVFDIGGNIFYARGIVALLPDRIGCHGLRPGPGMLAGRSVEVTALAESCAKAIADARLPRPIHLVGFSFGGLLAYETARHLDPDGTKGIMAWVLDMIPERPRGLTLVKEVLRQPYGFLSHLKQKLIRVMRRNETSVLHTYGFARFDLNSHPKPYREFIAKFYGAMSRHHARAWPGGHVRLICMSDTQDIRSLQSDLGWECLVPGGVHVTQLRGSHNDLVKEPSALAAVATALDAAIPRHKIAEASP